MLPLQADVGRDVDHQGDGRRCRSHSSAIGLHDQIRIQATAGNLVDLGRKRKTVGQDDPSGGESWFDDPGDKVGSCRQEQEQFSQGGDFVVGVEQRPPHSLGDGSSARLPNPDRVDPPLHHPLREAGHQRRLAGAFRPLDDDECSGRRAHSVMMLLVAPESIPWLMCSFTFVMSLSKFARATT